MVQLLPLLSRPFKNQESAMARSVQAAILAAICSTAGAVTISFSPAESARYGRDAKLTDPFGSPIYYVFADGDDRDVVSFNDDEIEWRNLRGFDLSELDAPVVSASLQFTVIDVNLGSTSFANPVLRVFDVVSDRDADHRTAFSDLGFGEFYATQQFTPEDVGVTFDLPLSDVAVDEINRDPSYFAVGLVGWNLTEVWGNLATTEHVLLVTTIPEPSGYAIGCFTVLSGLLLRHLQ